MLNRIIEFSVRNKLLVGIFLIALIGYGSYSVTRLPIDAVPDITNNQVQLITVTPSLAAPEVERLITFPVEQATASIAGITEMRSFSRFGLSLVTIVFDDDIDIYWARQQVSERLAQIQDELPEGTGLPQLGPITTGLGEIYQYVVRPLPGYEKKYDAMQLRTIQDWIVRRQLLGTPGVADVSSFGGFLKQYEIAVNPERLKSLGVTVSDVFEAIEKNNRNTGGAYIERGSGVLFIRSEGLAENLNDLEQIVVKRTSQGTPVLLRDVATAKIGHAVRYGALTYNDEGEVAGAVVMMLKGANSSQVIRAVKNKVEQIKKTLPEGVTIEPFLDRTKMVNNAISTVETNLIEGALIVIFILVLFLGNLRAGLIVASVIPLSMLFAIIMMNIFGVSGNLMSLGALDFGLIVDGAVIIVEAVMHRLRHSKAFSGIQRINQQQMNGEVSRASSKMMNAAVFGQIIILIVYLPILSLKGIEGKMFKPMAQTVSFAILGAFLLSLTYVPMISSLLLSKKITHHDTFADKMMRWLEKRYQPILEKALSIPKLIIGVAIVLFAASILILSRLGGEFIPQLEEGDFAVETRMLLGTFLPTGVEYVQQASKILKDSFPEVEKVVTKLGSGEIPTDPMPMDWGDMMVILKDKKEWTSASSYNELAEKMSLALEDVPGISVGFQFPVQMRFNELTTGARQDVVCKIFGEDLDTLAHYSKQLGAVAGNIEGARDLYVETVTGLPQIVVDFRREDLARYGIRIEDANTLIRTAFAGEVAGKIYEGEKRFDVVVRLSAEERRSVEDVRNLMVPTPSGMQIPLDQIADISIKEGPNQIQREDAKRRITVGFNVRGRDVQSIVNELRNKVSASIKLPPGYYITYGGQFENLTEAKKRLSVAVPVALLLIFLLLYFAFHSVKQGLLIFSAIPLSAIGGIIALALRGMPFSISAGVGFIALFGVAVLNGIVLITEFNRLKNEGGLPIRDVVLKGTRVRLRPVLMTATVASLGFLPMALSQGAGAEVQRPLATVVIGGLITATLLTLILLPVLYIISEKKQKPLKFDTMKRMLLLLIASAFPAMVDAQEKKISLGEAETIAAQSNPEIIGLELRTEVRKKMEGTAFNPEKASLTAEYGKINSLFNDNSFGISQSFNWPSVYKKQRSLLQSQTALAEAEKMTKTADVLRRLRQSWVGYLYWTNRKALLERADTLYAGSLEREDLRFQAGQTGRIDRTFSENQLLQNKIEIRECITEINNRKLELKYLLGSKEDIVPTETDLTGFLSTRLPVPGELTKNPELMRIEKELEISRREYELARAHRSPDITVGYNNMSIQGWQQDGNNVEKFYGTGERFGSAQLGIALPIFGKAYKRQIEASGLQTRAMEQAAEARRLETQTQSLQALQQYIQSMEILKSFSETLLANAETSIELANQQIQNGAIGYLEWSGNIRQALAIRAGYLDAQLICAEQLITILYLSGK